jgi:hypothetical protein
MALVLTLVNLGLLGYQLTGAAPSRDEAAVLRGRGLEVLDAQGRLRAELKIEPADPAYRWPDGTRVGYPETVIFRLVTADGKPRVKVTTSAEGSGLLLLGDADATHATLAAQGERSSLRLRDGDGSGEVLAPEPPR